VPPHLSEADELLDIPLNEDGLQRQLQQLPTQDLCRLRGALKGAVDFNTVSDQRTVVQVPPQLSGVDELLDIPLDEDCLQRLLSGNLADDNHARLQVWLWQAFAVAEHLKA